MILLILIEAPDWLQWLAPFILFFVANFWCLCPSCLICFDNFTRANNSDIDTGSACGWTEVSGSWAISGNLLQIASSNAIAISTAVHSGPHVKVVAEFSGTSNTNDQDTVIVTYQNSSNYNYARVTGTSLNIFRVQSGTHTSLASATISRAINTPFTVTICVYPGSNGNTEMQVAALGKLIRSTVNPYGNQVGLGTRSMTGTASVSSFALSSGDGGCECVTQNCSRGGIPKEFAVYLPGTFVSAGVPGFTGNCTDFGEQTAYIINPSAYAVPCGWHGCFPDGPILPYGGPGGYEEKIYSVEMQLAADGSYAWLQTYISGTFLNAPPCFGGGTLQNLYQLNNPLGAEFTYWDDWPIGDMRTFPYDNGNAGPYCTGPMTHVEVTRTA